MPYIAVIDPYYNELENIKAKMISEKKAKREPTKTTFSEVVCMLIKNYYDSAKKLGGESNIPNISPLPVSYNDLAERSISDAGETNRIQGGNTISPVESSFSVLKTTKLKYDIPKKDYEEFLDLCMKFYGFHEKDLDDVSIALEDGKQVVIIETKFVAQFKRFALENDFYEVT